MYTNSAWSGGSLFYRKKYECQFPDWSWALAVTMSSRTVTLDLCTLSSREGQMLEKVSVYSFCCSRIGFREFARIHKIQENKYIKWKTWKKGGRDELRAVPQRCSGCSVSWPASGFPRRSVFSAEEGNLLCETPHSNRQVKNMFLLRRRVIIPHVKIAFSSRGCSEVEKL